MGEMAGEDAETGASYAERPIVWGHSGDGEFPYRAAVGGAELVIRVNDFPAEPLYSLLVDGELNRDLEDWPACWTRPRTPPELLLLAAETQVRRGRIDAIVTAAWASALCLLAPGPASAAVAALRLTGALNQATGYQLLEPPPPGTGRFEIAESRGDVFTVRVTLTVPAVCRGDLDTMLGPGSAVPRVHYDSSFQLCYRVAEPGAPYGCDVFAAFADAPDEPGAVPQSLLFRRQAVS